MSGWKKMYKVANVLITNFFYSQGDSGGPLLAANRVIGITSFMLKCANGYPDGFTRVSAYLDWIKGTINNNEPRL